MPILAEDIAVAEKKSGLTWAQIKLLQRISWKHYTTWSALARGRSGESRKELRRDLEALIEQGLVLPPRPGGYLPDYIRILTDPSYKRPPDPRNYRLTEKGEATLRAASRGSGMRSRALKLTSAEIKILLRLSWGAVKRWSDLAAGIAGGDRQKMRQACESLLKQGLVWRVLTPSPNGYPRFAYTLTKMGDSCKHHLKLSNV